MSLEKLTALEFGNFIFDGQQMLCVKSADYDRALLSRGNAPGDLELSLHLEDGRSVSVKAQPRVVSERSLSEGLYTVYECASDFVIDGEKYCGFVELGFNREPTRWFNEKKIKDLKL